MWAIIAILAMIEKFSGHVENIGKASSSNQFVLDKLFSIFLGGTC
jgi:hypothetical protein